MTTKPMMALAWPRLVLLLASVALLGAACSSPSTTTTAPAQPVHTAGSPASNANVDCASVNSLRGSLESLSHTSISPSSAATLTSDLANVQVQAAKLKGSAGGSLSGQISGLSASVDQVTKAAGELSTNPSMAVPELTTALHGLKDKAGPLIAQMNATCPK